MMDRVTPKQGFVFDEVADLYDRAAGRSSCRATGHAHSLPRASLTRFLLIVYARLSLALLHDCLVSVERTRPQKINANAGRADTEEYETTLITFS
jgi:hypothetical protein